MPRGLTSVVDFVGICRSSCFTIILCILFIFKFVSESSWLEQKIPRHLQLVEFCSRFCFVYVIFFVFIGILDSPYLLLPFKILTSVWCSDCNKFFTLVAVCFEAGQFSNKTKIIRVFNSEFHFSIPKSEYIPLKNRMTVSLKT